MLQSLKNKALALDEAARKDKDNPSIGSSSSSSSSSSSMTDEESLAVKTNDNNDEDSYHNGSKYAAIVQALQAMKPTSLQLVDKSEMYDDKKGEESHFELYIVASAFEGLNVIKRQQLIYMMVGDVMPQIEALQITSLTPDEAK